ncbi:hypothetical protein [Streptomyces sp. NPDC047009]|uniref:hypothetical protein n=1 Tax=Streptomyces sp. NPDC047009 TaxID=3154496 RepID=UPI0033FE321E
MTTEEPSRGHSPPVRQLADQLHLIGPGWHPLLLRLHEQLLVLDPGYQVDELKEKLGAARIRITGTKAACAEVQARVTACPQAA